MFMTIKKVNCRNVSDGISSKKFIWVDIGSKFAKMSNLLTSMTSFDTRHFLVKEKA